LRSIIPRYSSRRERGQLLKRVVGGKRIEIKTMLTGRGEKGSRLFPLKKEKSKTDKESRGEGWGAKLVRLGKGQKLVRGPIEKLKDKEKKGGWWGPYPPQVPGVTLSLDAIKKLVPCRGGL